MILQWPDVTKLVHDVAELMAIKHEVTLKVGRQVGSICTTDCLLIASLPYKTPQQKVYSKEQHAHLTKAEYLQKQLTCNYYKNNQKQEQTLSRLSTLLLYSESFFLIWTMFLRWHRWLKVWAVQIACTQEKRLKYNNNLLNSHIYLWLLAEWSKGTAAACTVTGLAWLITMASDHEFTD